MDGNILLTTAMVACLQRLYQLMVSTSNAVGDMSLVEYAFLLDAAEFDDGIPLRDLERDFDCFKNPLHFAELLQDKELARRVRNKADLRSHALHVTAKGRGRIELVDKSCAMVFASSDERIREADMEHLVAQLAHANDAFAQGRRTATIVPCMALVALCRYHRFVARGASQLGLPPLHAAILAALERFDASEPAGQVAKRLGLDVDVIDFQLASLREKGLVRFDGAYGLTPEGERRVEALIATTAPELQADLAKLPPEVVDIYIELGEYLAYLYR